MSELNSYGSSSSEVDVMIFDDERKDQFDHGAFGGSTARQHYLVAMPDIRQKLVGEVVLDRRLY